MCDCICIFVILCVLGGLEGIILRQTYQPITEKNRKNRIQISDTQKNLSLHFIEKTKVAKDTTLVSMDVTSLYTNIPQEEGIEIVCRTYEIFYGNELPIPTHFLREMLRLILKENSFQTHGTAMGTKMAVSFANIFMAEVETDIINQSPNKPLIWKRYIDDIFSLWNTNKEAIHNFTKLANSFHPTIKFTAEISDTEITFLDTCVYKGDRFKKHSILDVRTHFKPTETF